MARLENYVCRGCVGWRTSLKFLFFNVLTLFRLERFLGQTADTFLVKEWKGFMAVININRLSLCPSALDLFDTD